MRRPPAAALLAALAACVGSVPTDEHGTADLEITENLYEDMTNIDLGDLVWGTGALATQGINDLLDEIPYTDIRLSDTDLYGLPEAAEDDLTIHDLGELTTGLADRFGEQSLPARVNAIRLAHLRHSRDRVYAESSFRAGLQIGHELRQDAPGLGADGASVTVGFTAGVDVEARVVAAHRGELRAVAGNPLAAITEIRGFVLPRTLDDVRDGMKPGESLALRGHGRLGTNFGAGVPLLVANPLESVTYSVVLSGGLRTVLEGALDVQIVRLDGHEAIVDVGLTDATVVSAYLAIEDGWGVSGLVRSSVSIGPVTLDVGQLVGNALRRELNHHVDLVSARAERGASSRRESVARFRIDLREPTDEVEKAVGQAVRGDIRLAQSLANRGAPGIGADLDVVRSARSTWGHLGFELFGMRFFTETLRTEGEAVVQTPGGSLSVMYDSLAKSRGGFVSEHGYARTVLSGFEVTAGERSVKGQTNLRFEWTEADDYMQRDKMLDQLEGLLALVLGPSDRQSVAALLDEIGRQTQAACAGLSNFDGNAAEYARCKMRVLRRPGMLARVDEARESFARALEASEASDSERALAAAAFELALAANRAYEPQAALAGPPTRMNLASWYSEAAVDGLMLQRTGAELRAAVADLVPFLGADRASSDGLTSSADLDADALGSIERRYDSARQRYRDLVALGEEEVPGVGTLGDGALAIQVPVDRDLVPLYEDMLVQSLARRRAQVVADLVDSLVRRIRPLDDKPERVLGFALLSLTPPSLRDLRVDVDMDIDDNWAQSFEQYEAAGYAPLHLSSRGASVRLLGELIGWDVDRLVAVQR